jgi:acetyltransferase-like isoleucine patch superfamily enzyme
MREIPFSDCRDALGIPPGFSDDNLIVTDGEIDNLPNLKFVRHGNPGKSISNCRFEIPSSTKGNIALFAGGDGARVKIGQNTRLICSIRLWRSPSVEIGDNTTINNARLVSDKSDIVIGPDCMFSDDILIQSSDQHGLVNLETNQFLNSMRRQVTLGEHVWVGRGAKVMPDVTVGPGTVLGTGCIVTEDMPACVFAVGVPARVVRTNSSWTRSPTKISEREQDFFRRTKKEIKECTISDASGS